MILFISSRGQPRQGENQMDTEDDPLWLYCHRMFSKYLLPEKNMGLTVRESGGKLTH